MNTLLLAVNLGFSGIYLIAAIVVIFVVFISLMFGRYKKCPSDKILVVHGKIRGGGSSKCVHGGASFIWPIIQDYSFLSLTPMSIEVNLINALTKQNIRLSIPSRFTIGISTEASVMQNAVERLLGLGTAHVQELAQEIIFGQLRLVVASMTIEEINTDRVKFLSHVSQSVETELKKVGLKLINVNITDICDETGYIEALGKAAAAKAINDAIISVSQEDRDGAIGQATAVQDQRVQVADLNAKATIGEANANQNERIHTADAEAKATIGEAEANKQGRVHVAEANAKSIEGENVFQIDIAESNASRRERQAEANKRATSSEMIQSAKALEEAYAAEKLAENARAIRKEAEQQADIIVPAQINKQKIEIEAEAQAERIRRIAKGEADAIFLRKEAEAKGLYQILTKQAEGFDRIVKAAKNDPQDTELLLIADKLSELVKTQAEAIKNGIIWETDTRKFGDSAANSFISGMYKSVPPLDMFEAGMKLPNFLKEGGVKKDRAEITTPEVLPKKDLSTASEQVAKSNSTTNKK